LFGTGRYLLLQTIVVPAWIPVNLFAAKLHWDPYPFILLNLAFLRRPRTRRRSFCSPRTVRRTGTGSHSERTLVAPRKPRPTPSIWARELAALRLAIGEVVTREHLRRELENLRALLVDSQLEIPGAATSPARDDLERAVKKFR